MHISAQHLAELLVGIARAQAASVQGIEKAAARLRDRAQPSLADLPTRILLDVMGGRAGPDVGAIARHLERLCAGATPGGGPGDDLDFGAPPP